MAGGDGRCEDLRFTLLNMITPELLAYVQLPRDKVKRPLLITPEVLDEMRNPAMEIALPERLTSTLRPADTVHILYHGKPLCDFHPGVPGNWPEGHKWVSVDDPKEVNCMTCNNVYQGMKKRGVL
jgi:hypothetical protein